MAGNSVLLAAHTTDDYFRELGAEEQPYQAAVSGYGGATDWFSSPQFFGGDQLLESLQHTIAPIQYDAATQMVLWGWVGDSLQTWLGDLVEPYTAEQLEHAARSFVEGFFNTLLSALEEALTPYDGESDVTSPARNAHLNHSQEVEEKYPDGGRRVTERRDVAEFDPNKIPVSVVEDMVEQGQARYYRENTNLEDRNWVFIADVWGPTVRIVILEKHQPTRKVWIPGSASFYSSATFREEDDGPVAYRIVANNTASNDITNLSPQEIAEEISRNLRSSDRSLLEDNFVNRYIEGYGIKPAQLRKQQAESDVQEAIFRVIPFGNFALELSDGNNGAAYISLVGDLATFTGAGMVVGGVGKVTQGLRVLTISGNLIVGGHAAYKAHEHWQAGENGAAAGYVGLAFLNLLGAGLDARALAKSAATRGLGTAAGNLDNGTATGAIHRVGKAEFADLDHTGVALRSLSSDKIRITDHGIDVVERHLSRFTRLDGKPFGSNTAMLHDLRRIAKGELQATKVHRDFYAHELREFVRFRAKGFKTGMPHPSIYKNAHYATLKEYGIPFENHSDYLMTPFAQSMLFW